MREYELIYVIQPDASDERLQEIHERIDGTVTGGQGLILLRDDWGKRKLAYEIDKFQKGHYFQLCFLGDGKFIKEAERLMRIDPDVLRFLTVLVKDEVSDIEARVAEAKEQAAEQAQRREERERLEAEREAERAEMALSRPAVEGRAPDPPRADAEPNKTADAEPDKTADPDPVPASE